MRKRARIDTVRAFALSPKTRLCVHDAWLLPAPPLPQSPRLLLTARDRAGMSAGIQRRLCSYCPGSAGKLSLTIRCFHESGEYEKSERLLFYKRLV
ncbi:hypothetical protein CSB45_11170 [candidate division KSB3 bacterium]|uniref:Uncharacterized protein n=1 Tax=candidate division KSB3 bacterium TaxID=2044937 RepID=A0A2G6E3M7_9BACT|nr:MAG: hypothetical protein CSB45_11170 [candidate division KSB3 bacterium]PIE29031.1 MAG: hypothetical protein CSA57_10435 [candidate division KSB3 bacterium]